MGDPVFVVGTTKLIAQLPVAATVKLFRDGEVIQQKTGDRVTLETKSPGTYRVEAWLEADGEARPWIYGNPIYLRLPDLAALALPSMETRTNVEIIKDITYVDGKAEDEAKHKLDIYLPKGKTNFPVFLFIHGGSWRSGDRTQYPPLGNRYASEGIATVVMSYRLAPKNRHPAQIEDCAAALAWVLKNIGQYGGDTNRVFVGGHSAGGHLAALLALGEDYLSPFGISNHQIHGVICLSGAYDVRDGNEKVFGPDEEVKRKASPLFHIKKTGFPFLITYCEWDYFPLATQAQEFHAALLKAGVDSRLIFVPKQSHISEMLVVTREDDMTASSVTGFVIGAKSQ